MSDKKKAEEPPPPELNDTEEKLVTKLAEAIEALLDDSKGGAGNVDREFDAAFNPFPAELHVVIPSEPVEVEGFSRTKEGGLTVKMTSVLDAVGSLEGKWVSPDPLAAMMRAEEGTKQDFARRMANEPRRAVDVVRSDEVRDSLVSVMRPASRYRVRWIAGAPEKRRASAD